MSDSPQSPPGSKPAPKRKRENRYKDAPPSVLSVCLPGSGVIHFGFVQGGKRKEEGKGKKKNKLTFDCSDDGPRIEPHSAPTARERTSASRTSK
ncbi:hypothetical protein SODALDRAFT_334863 [Sodiomyces alkalinus F11]|uniref:Uncharacterized protein n=1 Tax=Sodiomyces alkalinus (strain CBS 110278 / VKM F-3762 / F11) TaxID=1314773 RepID=A0A3N2PTC1_SODAK|nr:hypothetical protein SODALDRAFT_334863 [Sodiomyces alkalinus F11]ROT37731.1 hypothetical protein SODALDRAFT_334863 [Sodiomyces alkalinus F11]